MKKNETIEILQKQIDDLKNTIDNLKESSNPQIKEMVTRCEGELDAYEAMMYYVKTGSKLYFVR